MSRLTNYIFEASEAGAEAFAATNAAFGYEPEKAAPRLRAAQARIYDVHQRLTALMDDGTPFAWHALWLEIEPLDRPEQGEFAFYFHIAHAVLAHGKGEVINAAGHICRALGIALGVLECAPKWVWEMIEDE